MHPKPFLWLFLASFGFLCPIARADTGMCFSVEWMVALGDQIGVYRVENISETNTVVNGTGFSTGHYLTTEFKLVETLRGNPPPNFSRSGPYYPDSKLWRFYTGNSYVFFFHDQGGYGQDNDAFGLNFMGDNIWLDRKDLGEGIAIDHHGEVLTNKNEILKVIKASLKLPRAYPGIGQSAYNYSRNSLLNPDWTNFNFHVLDFPMTVKAPTTDEQRTLLIANIRDFVIPECLYSPTMIDPETSGAMMDVLWQIGRQMPGVRLLGVNCGIPASSPSAGVEYAMTGFSLHTNSFNSDFAVKITRFASSSDAQKELKNISRQKKLPPHSIEAPDKHVNAHLFVGNDQTLICQDDSYLLEMDFTTEGGRALMTKVSDIALKNLDLAASQSR